MKEKEFDWRKDMQDESFCNENPSKIWVNTYINKMGPLLRVIAEIEQNVKYHILQMV